MDDSLHTHASDPIAAAPEQSQLVLCVDDEPNVLSALRRALRACGCTVVTAGGGAEGLAAMRDRPADVVVSDMRMPAMDGIEFLEQIHGSWPDTVRILLTGNAEMSAAIAAINRGRINRYFNKPWDDQELIGAVRQGLKFAWLLRERARLEKLTQSKNLELRSLNESLEQRVAERTSELSEANKKLKRGFLTSIRVFTNLLELRGGRHSGHSRRVGDLARAVARAMALSDQEIQDTFLAALLHDLGHIGLPDAMLDKPVARLEPAELAQYRQHSLMGEQALMAFDDMQSVATLIHAHHERYNGSGYPDGKAGLGIPLGARILAIVDTYDELQNGHLGGAKPSAEESRVLLQQGRGSQFDPEILDVFLQVTNTEMRREETALTLASEELRPGMVLASDLISPEGVLLLSAGYRLTDVLIRRICTFELRAEQKFRLRIQRR